MRPNDVVTRLAVVAGKHETIRQRLHEYTGELKGTAYEGSGGSSPAGIGSSSTERAMGIKDPARTAQRRLGALWGSIEKDLAELEALADFWAAPKVKGNAHLRGTEAGDPICESCERLGVESTAALSRALESKRFLCDWCSTFAKREGKLPPRGDLEKHHRRGRSSALRVVK